MIRRSPVPIRTAVLACCAGLLAIACPILEAQQPGADALAATAQPVAVSRHNARADASADWQFMRAASAHLHAQMAAARLASKRAESPALRQLAKRMLRGATRTSHHLDLLALQTQIPLPSKPDRATRREFDHLKARHGPAFDAAFLGQFGVDQQRETVRLFADEARMPEDRHGLPGFARRMLPDLRATLQQAEALRDGTAGDHAPAS